MFMGYLFKLGCLFMQSFLILWLNTNPWQGLRCLIPNLEEFPLFPYCVLKQNSTSCGTHLISDWSFHLGELKALCGKCQVIINFDLGHFILSASEKLYEAKKNKTKQNSKAMGCSISADLIMHHTRMWALSCGLLVSKPSPISLMCWKMVKNLELSKVINDHAPLPFKPWKYLKKKKLRMDHIWWRIWAKHSLIAGAEMIPCIEKS